MYYHGAKVQPFVALLGKVLVSVIGGEGDEEMRFTTTDGEVFVMYHDQSCCESVSVESIVGDLSDLLGEPITLAEEVSSDTTDEAAAARATPSGWTPDESDDSYTWTFYKLATRKGYVDIRWFGSSNGYYGEGVDFVLMPSVQ